LKTIRSIDDLIALVKEQANLLIAVATGGPRIDDVDENYQARRRELRLALEAIGLADPFPWRSLWEWYRAWSGGYADRRAEINRLAGPLLDELDTRAAATRMPEDTGATGMAGWSSVDARLQEMLAELERGSSPDDWSDIGRRCREIVIEAAQVVFLEVMVPPGKPIPGLNDAEERLSFFADLMLSGTSNQAVRGLIRKLIVLANALTHQKSPTRLMAFATAQATISLVRVLQEADRNIPF
jgi:hypothetical protein